MSLWTFVRLDDWQGIYVDGDLKHEGHSIDEVDVVFMAIEHPPSGVHVRYPDDDWAETISNLPKSLSDVVLST